jgi:type IV pilus assembly protein PilM
MHNSKKMKNAIKSWLSALPSRLPTLSVGLGSPLLIGLDMGPNRLNLVQMMQVGGKPALSAIAAVPYPCARNELMLQPKQLKLLLRQAFARQPFKGKRVVSCLPAEQMKIISLNYSHTEGQADDAAIIAELRERMKGELDNMVVDYLPLRQEDADAGKRDALVALAPRDHVLAYLDLLTSAGLQVEALDIGPAALARLVKHAGARHYPDFPLTPNSLLINFGADSSYLTVIWGRRTVLDRAVEFCENRLLKRLQLVLHMPPELAMQVLYRDDLARGEQDETAEIVAEVFRPELALLHQEISRTLVYMASRTRGKSVDAVFLAGPVARCPGVVTSLRHELKVPVNILNPITDFSLATGHGHDEALGTMAGIALTAGLALRGVPEND